ncbi:hypothetical protein EG328_009841 [Venturia inaequalis]|uniref:FAD/NAD(P)-binding domain-containing protein n=1 Tax=Venturia inaequalis TaxID=5025 RepID=A0A8H3Z8M3_VENIN|nr:hypothetical protein EG328_009841 [Venturia inaequalis]
MGSIEPPQPDYDVLIIGAGLSGCYASYRMQQMGLKFKVLETGTAVGGTWYWNRYPGARFDCESYAYGFFFSKEVLDEWRWSEHFAPQAETEQYINFICDKYNLKGNMQFNTRVDKAHWLADGRCWKLTDQNGHTYTSRFLITGIGLLSNPTLPNIPGVKEFKGTAFHTSRWPDNVTEFTGKNVGIIGVGATGIQIIPEIAKTAKSLTVFQRTPNWAIPLHNSKIGEEEMETIRKGYPELLKKMNANRMSFIHDGTDKSIWEASPEEREAFWEFLYAQPGFGFWVSNYKEVLMDRDANALLSDFVAKKIRQRVKDPWTADKLTPKTHGFGLRRVPMETHYYEAYNQPNVRLVDVLETPIECITEEVTGAFEAIDFRGNDNILLADLWRDGTKTYLGLTVEHFPNMLMSIGPHQAYGNITRSIEFAVDWISNCIEYLRGQNITYIEATGKGVQEWTDHVHDIGKALLSNTVDSWLTGVNKNLPGKQKRTVAKYSGSAVDFKNACNAVAKARYDTFKLA